MSMAASFDLVRLQTIIERLGNIEAVVGTGLADAHVVDAALRRVAAVSYTHLDVYKRQVCMFTLAIRISPSDKKLFLPSG